MNKTPCKDCYAPKRKLMCHAHCEEYKAWKEELEETNRRKNAENEIKYTAPPQKMTAIRRKMRWR